TGSWLWKWRSEGGMMERLLPQRFCPPSELGNPQKTRVSTFPQRRRLLLSNWTQLLNPRKSNVSTDSRPEPFNEEGNVREVYERVRTLMLGLGRYRYEHIFIDNASRDTTFTVLSEIAAADSNVKVIRNARNFGHVRSPMHAL